MGFTDDFESGTAEHMAANGIGVFNPAAVYADNDFGIIINAIPVKPANLITVTAYEVENDPTSSDSVLGLQVRVRRDGQNPKTSGDTADQLFDLFHGAHGYFLPTGVRVTQSMQRSRLKGGQDEHQRWSTIQNFYFDLWRPSPHRP